MVVTQECKSQDESAQEEVDAQAPTGLPWSNCTVQICTEWGFNLEVEGLDALDIP